MDIKNYLKREQKAIDAYLEKYVPKAVGAHGRIYKAVRYSLFAGGKRVRPVLALAVSRALQGPRPIAMAGGCAVEMIHTYSLIHDDLPCMDDDDFRRGRPSSHKKFDEATAVLAGDALQAMAFELISRRITDSEQSVDIARELAAAAGPEGMVGGQMLDMKYEGTGCSLKQLHDLHARKTGAMIRAAVRIGALAAGASGSLLTGFTAFGTDLGLLFQVVDDILDVTSDSKKLGKTAGKDAASGKSTFPGLLGLEKARDYRDKLHGRATKNLAVLGKRAATLEALTEFIAYRDH